MSSVQGQPGGGGDAPVFSPDGAKVAFTRIHGLLDVNAYVTDLAGGAISLVSVDPAGTAAGSSRAVSFAGNDRVVFFSGASDLGPPDTGYGRDWCTSATFATDTTVMLSANSPGTGGGNRDSVAVPGASGGNTVAFISTLGTRHARQQRALGRLRGPLRRPG